MPLGLTLDPVSRSMLFMVTGVGALIHIYSLGYMGADEGKSRYFAGLSLFMFSMLGIVLANNFVMMFIFWELVGVSSYLLIGHWFERPAAAEAAKKAFITNRIGDFGFMLGILMVWTATGSLVFTDIAAGMAKFTGHPGYLTTAALLVFCGAVGKSAQFPLHVWLPDAMEGPTPVSALIHAATMVAAGVYMLVRVGFLIDASSGALEVIAWIGTITALLAALMAIQQNDIKRILAYSTLSQLGYMVMAVGLASGRPRCSISSPTPLSRRFSSSAPVRLFSCSITSKTSGGWADWRSGCPSPSSLFSSAPSRSSVFPVSAASSARTRFCFSPTRRNLPIFALGRSPRCSPLST